MFGWPFEDGFLQRSTVGSEEVGLGWDVDSGTDGETSRATVSWIRTGAGLSSFFAGAWAEATGIPAASRQHVVSHVVRQVRRFGRSILAAVIVGAVIGCFLRNGNVMRMTLSDARGCNLDESRFRTQFLDRVGSAIPHAGP